MPFLHFFGGENLCFRVGDLWTTHKKRKLSEHQQKLPYLDVFLYPGNTLEPG